MIQLVQLVLVSFLVHPIQAAVHPAKRQNTLTFEDVCGIDAQDCGNGWCCYPGSECIPASLSAPDPLCRDLAVFDSTDVAFGYSSFISLMNFDYLTSLGITVSTFPTILPTTGRFTALPTYTDNVLPTKTPVPTTETPSVTSTAAAILPTVNLGYLVGGIAGVGVFAGI